jgi:hypothetical protein
MRTRFCTLSVPSAGDYLDIAICIGGRKHESGCR